MKKRIMISSLIAVYVISCTTSTFAAENPTCDKESENVAKAALLQAESLDISTEINKAFDGVIDSRVSKNVLDSVSVLCTDDEVDVSYTVSYLGDITEYGSTTGSIYTLTAATKTTSTYVTEDNVDCWISLTWIDNLGTNNEIVKVTGGWNANGRTLSDRQVYYGITRLNGGFISGLSESKFPTSNTFSYKPSKTLSGLYLTAYSWVSSSGYPYLINCTVKPTIFD